MTPTVLVDTSQPIYSSSALLFVGSTNRYLFFGTGSDLLAASTPGGGSSGTGTAFKLYGVQDSLTVGAAGIVRLERDLSPKVVSTGLLTNGERPTSSPTVAGDIVFFTTTTDAAVGTCSDATTKLYGFTYLGTAAYDTNGNGKIDSNESPVITTAAGRGTAPFIVDQHLFLSTTSLLGDWRDRAGRPHGLQQRRRAGRRAYPVLERNPMNSLWQTPAVVVMILSWLASPPAGLGEVAQREALRRAATPKATASLTNFGQFADEPPPAAVTLPASATPPAVTPPAEETPPPTEPKRDEKWWRARVAGIRTAIERGQTMAEALQSRINALQADVVNIDDPAQQAKARNDLGKALGELDRQKKQIDADTKALADLGEEARRLNVPAGWIR